MIRLYFAVCSVILSVNVFAQVPNLNVLWEQSPGLEWESVSYGNAFKKNDNGFYVLERRDNRNQKFKIYKYNNQLERLEHSSFSPKKGTWTSKDQFLVLKNGLVALKYIKGTSKIEVALSKVATDSFKLGDTVRAAVYYDNADFPFFYAISADKTKIAVIYPRYRSMRHTQDFYVSVFDEDLNKLWTKEVVYRIKDAHFDAEKMLVDNEANVYLLSHVKDNGYRINGFYNDGENMAEVDLPSAANYVYGVKVVFDDELNLHVGALYSEKKRLSITTTAGSCYWKIDKTNLRITNGGLEPFGPDILVEDMEVCAQVLSTEKKGESGLKIKEKTGFLISHLFVTQEGNTRMLIEHENLSLNHTTHQLEANCNEVIVVARNIRGQKEWDRVVVKNQAGTVYRSYFPVEKEGHLFLLFNESKENEGFKFGDAKYIEWHPGDVTNIVKVHLNPQGHKERAYLSVREKANMIVVPFKSEQFDENRYLLRFYKNNQESTAMLLVE